MLPFNCFDLGWQPVEFDQNILEVLRILGLSGRKTLVNDTQRNTVPLSLLSGRST